MNYMKPCPICNFTSGRIVTKINNIGLCKCNSCNFVYANLPDKMIAQANSRHNAAAFKYYESRQTLVDRAWHLRIFKKISAYNNKGKILDIGCGNGRLLSIFRLANWDCYGLDISPWGEIAAKKHGFSFFRGVLDDAPYTENFFDAVLCTSTLEHIIQPALFLKLVKRILKPDSILYLSGIPNYMSLTVRLGIHPFKHNRPPDCANYFTPHTLKIALDKSGFTDYRIKSYGIPDAFYIYNRLVKIFRKCGQLQNNRSDKGTEDLPKDNKHNLVTSKILCFLYYYLCLPNTGDKLEATVMK